MKRMSLGAVAAGTLVMLCSATLGADASSLGFPAAPLLFYYWNAPYLGARGGWGWTTTRRLNAEGVFGGGQVGYNYELMRYFIVGVEADGAFANISRGAGAPF